MLSDNYLVQSLKQFNLKKKLTMYKWYDILVYNI